MTALDDRTLPRCRACGKRVRFWQRYDGFGPMGFRRRNAQILWHSKCRSGGAS